MTGDGTGGQTADDLIDLLRSAGRISAQPLDDTTVARMASATAGERRAVHGRRSAGRPGRLLNRANGWPWRAHTRWTAAALSAAAVIAALLTSSDIGGSLPVVTVEAGNPARTSVVDPKLDGGTTRSPTGIAGPESEYIDQSDDGGPSTAVGVGAAAGTTTAPPEPAPPRQSSLTADRATGGETTIDGSGPIGTGPSTSTTGPSTIRPTKSSVSTTISTPQTTTTTRASTTSSVEPRSGYTTHSYVVGSAGSVTVSFNSSGVIVESVAAAPGWNQQFGSRTSRLVDLTFIGPDHNATFTISVGSSTTQIDIDPGTNRSSASQVVKRFQVGKAGSVTIRYSDIAVVVDDIITSSGWRHWLGTQSQGLTDIRFSGGDDDDSSASFIAKVDKGGLQIAMNVSDDD